MSGYNHADSGHGLGLDERGGDQVKAAMYDQKAASDVSGYNIQSPDADRAERIGTVGIIDVEGLNYLVGAKPRPLERSKGGLFLPTVDTDKEHHGKYGVIADVGNGITRDDGTHQPCKYKRGQTIYFNRFTMPCRVAGEERRFVREGDVVAIVDPEVLGLEFDAVMDFGAGDVTVEGRA